MSARDGDDAGTRQLDGNKPRIQSVGRALRLLDREAWEERARADMRRLRTEDLSAEADAWEYDADGNIRITGTGLTVPARSQDRR